MSVTASMDNYCRGMPVRFGMRNFSNDLDETQPLHFSDRDEITTREFENKCEQDDVSYRAAFEMVQKITDFPEDLRQCYFLPYLLSKSLEETIKGARPIHERIVEHIVDRARVFTIDNLKSAICGHHSDELVRRINDGVPWHNYDSDILHRVTYFLMDSNTPYSEEDKCRVLDKYPYLPESLVSLARRHLSDDNMKGLLARICHSADTLEYTTIQSASKVGVSKELMVSMTEKLKPVWYYVGNKILKIGLEYDSEEIFENILDRCVEPKFYLDREILAEAIEKGFSESVIVKCCRRVHCVQEADVEKALNAGYSELVLRELSYKVEDSLPLAQILNTGRAFFTYFG